MSIKFLKLSLGIAVFAFSLNAPAAEWNYEGDINAHWAKLGVCGTGTKQSGINVVNPQTDRSLTAIVTDYDDEELTVKNNGHTIQVDYPAGSTMSVNGVTYNLLQFHFHTPSENTVNGVSYPMEMHLVHQSNSGAYAVLGAFFKVGSHNEALQDILNIAPASKGTSPHKTDADVEDLLPKNLSYYSWDGSLTTPPCTEGINWHLLKTPVQVSSAQIAQFQTFFALNARPVQPLNGRVIKQK